MQPVILIGQNGTVEGEFREDGFLYFVSLKGQKILVVHGSPEGAWPGISKKMIEKYNPDQIFCCFPKVMKRNTNDRRIQGNHMSKTLALIKKVDETGVVILLKEVK